jgi:hypothetical protein
MGMKLGPSSERKPNTEDVREKNAEDILIYGESTRQQRESNRRTEKTAQYGAS